MLIVLAGLDLVITRALGQCPPCQEVRADVAAEVNVSAPRTDKTETGHRASHGMSSMDDDPMLHPDVGDRRRLVTTGIASPAFLFIPVGCTVMMVMMMHGVRAVTSATQPKFGYTPAGD